MTARLAHFVVDPNGRHRVGVLLVASFYAAVILWVAIHGFSYYRLPLDQRVLSPLHRQFRPSGTVGIRLAVLGFASFCMIFLYAVRKRWRWLGKRGKTRHWLDVHVVMGTAAPILITFHCAFKMRGLAGMAYWIMIAVMLSGIVGRYLYAQIPRRINAAELSLQEMQALANELTETLQSQSLVSIEEMRPLMAVPARSEVEQMPVVSALLLMLRYDLERPLEVARLRRRSMSTKWKLLTAGGLLASHDSNLEKVINLARQQAWMATKIAFLSKTHAVFHLWHVVHRPFSYSFAILVSVHVAVAVLMGYF